MVNENFEDLLNNSSEYQIKEGTVVKGRVVGVNSDVAVIDVGLKNEGRIPLAEFALAPGDTAPQVGDMVDIYIEKIEGRNGRTVLSREKAIREESWMHLEVALTDGKLVDGVIFGRVKGGFTVDLSGVVAFLPGSQVDVRPVKDITPLMGIVQPFQILKMDKKLGNIVVSRRAIMEESRMEARDEMLSKIVEGQILEGVVKNITDYGAFVDLGNVDGLLHVTDISWSRINHPSEVLHIGQKVKVVVIKFNPETKRISLGMKQMDDNPWKNIREEFTVGKVMTGKVTNITDYGVFIELSDGIEGLVHASEINWTKSNQHPKKLLNIGQEVEFVILEIDTDKHRVSLSIKQCKPNPWNAFAASNPIGSVVKAPIRNITEFGMFVALGDDIDGMIHESDISADGRGAELLKTYQKGDEVECKVLFIDTEKERVSLGIKQLSGHAEASSEEASNSAHTKGDVVTCTVTAVQSEGLEVSVDEEIGFIKKIELSSIKSDQRSDKFAVGDRFDAKVISIDKKTSKLNLSLKALEIAEREKAIKEYGSADSGASLGDILGAALKGK
ncbi:MAG: 30S ribosomal protein S1 [Pseudomonadota bacterium]